MATAVMAALMVVGGASCAGGGRTPETSAAGGGDPCVDLPQAERDYCMGQRGFRGYQRPALDPKPSPSGY
jgi:hypothetical protein